LDYLALDHTRYRQAEDPVADLLLKKELQAVRVLGSNPTLYAKVWAPGNIGCLA